VTGRGLVIDPKRSKSIVNDRKTLDALGWDDQREQDFVQYHADGLRPARVTAEHRGAYVVRGVDGDVWAVARGRLRDGAILSGGLPAVGDWVAIRAGAGERAAIEALLERRTTLTRKTAWREADEQVLVANVDRLFIVSDLDRDANARRLERYLALAYESGATPVVVLTKLDLCDDPTNRILELDAVSFGVPVLPVSNVTGEGVDAVAQLLEPACTIALIGSSGVGKSTLINRLAGEEFLPTAGVRKDGRGRHTTRHRELFTLPGGALLVDTPGLRELQLWDGALDEAFADVDALAAECRFSDCGHDSEPGCAVQAAIAAGELDAARLASYRKLERELEAVAARRSRRVGAERKRRWRQRARESRQARRYGRRG
jgi:ribosome biogenesis GTPase / thiamine phosphate phosphatase